MVHRRLSSKDNPRGADGSNNASSVWRATNGHHHLKSTSSQQSSQQRTIRWVSSKSPVKQGQQSIPNQSDGLDTYGWSIRVTEPDQSDFAGKTSDRNTDNQYRLPSSQSQEQKGHEPVDKSQMPTSPPVDKSRLIPPDNFPELRAVSTPKQTQSQSDWYRTGSTPSKDRTTSRTFQWHQDLRKQKCQIWTDRHKFQWTRNTRNSGQSIVVQFNQMINFTNELLLQKDKDTELAGQTSTCQPGASLHRETFEIESETRQLHHGQFKFTMNETTTPWTSQLHQTVLTN